MTSFIQVTTTTETNEQAQRIAQVVVERRVAACAQIVGPISSTYWWKGKIETAQEWLCVMKTRSDLYQDLEAAIRENHPYEVPEILAVPIQHGSQPYLDWMRTELGGKP